MTYKHYSLDRGETSEQVTTEDGRAQYWRLSIPMWYELGMLWWRRYHSFCGKSFKSTEAAELHFRKAYEEEKAISQENK